jgi:outer membrane murein-binding lipoprotein Lpp
MSTSAAEARGRFPRLDPSAVQRARLAIVPSARSNAPRVPFVTLVSLILLAGVIGLLLFNTSMQQASFRETALAAQASDLGARQEALELQVQDLRDPKRIAREAQAMGLVIPTTPAGVVDLATGRISGDPQPAKPGDTLPLFAPPPDRPAELDPPPVVVDREERDTGRDPHRDRGRDPARGRDRDRNGAPDRDRGDDRPRLGDGRRTARR